MVRRGARLVGLALPRLRPIVRLHQFNGLIDATALNRLCAIRRLQLQFRGTTMLKTYKLLNLYQGERQCRQESIWRISFEAGFSLLRIPRESPHTRNNRDSRKASPYLLAYQAGRRKRVGR